MTKIVDNQIVAYRTAEVGEDAFVFRIGWDEPGEPCGDVLTPKGGVRLDYFFVAAYSLEEAFAKAKEFQPKAFNLRYTSLATVAILREAIGC